jgi:prepilin-type N-terminal cleavage/methylation domain-containing protein
MRSREGFTITELLVVLTIMGIVGGFAAVRIGQGLTQTHVQSAAAVISTDLKLAHSVASRVREPVRIAVNTGSRTVRVEDYDDPTTVYSERFFGLESETPLELMSVNVPSVLVFPNGLASGGIRITIRAAESRRRIEMTRAGQVRITEP